MTDSQDRIRKKCQQISDMLVEKNKAYGDSALDPVACFVHDLTPVQRMAVRMDDKISRLMRGGEFPGDDTLLDLAGYLVLMLIALEDQGRQQIADKVKAASLPCSRALRGDGHSSHIWTDDYLVERYCAGIA